MTLTPRGLVATFLPVLYEPAQDGYGSVVGHVARGNDQWQLPVLEDALMIVHGPDAYISPSWYPSKAGPWPGGADLGLRHGPRLRPVGGP